MSFSFGTPSSAPATAGSSLTGGFSFGANKPATPGFGLASTSQPSTGLFGSTAVTSAPAFGASTSFGAATTPAFGATATPAFGATTTPAFGATSAAPAFGSGGTSAFGATSTAPAFGTTPAFGATSAAPAFGATTTAPAFGSAGTGFGASLGTGGLNFGAGSNVASTAGTTLAAPTNTGLGGFGTGAPLFGATTTATTGLFGPDLIPITQSFQMIPPSSIAMSYSPNNSSWAAEQSNRYMLKSCSRNNYRTLSPSRGTNLGGSTMAGGLTTTTTPSLGLGGAAPFGTAATSSDSKSEPPKQMKLPNEIVTTIDSFKDFIKKQKSISSELMSVSVKPLYTVSRDAEATLSAAQALGGEVCRARAHSRRLRTLAARALASAEAVANSTGDLEGFAPPPYVSELISELEHSLHNFRRQMEVADKQMQAQPKLLTEQELTMGIRRMHESLVALAGRLQVVHSLVDAQREQYLNLRKYVLKDPTNVFDTPSSTTSLDQILCDADGSRKKAKTGGWSGAASAVLSDPRAALGANIQQLAGPSPFSYVGTTLSSFPTIETTGPSWQAPQPSTSLSFRAVAAPQPTETTSGFTLQKPPGKRGKQ